MLLLPVSKERQRLLVSRAEDYHVGLDLLVFHREVLRTAVVPEVHDAVLVDVLRPRGDVDAATADVARIVGDDHEGAQPGKEHSGRFWPPCCAHVGTDFVACFVEED